MLMISAGRPRLRNRVIFPVLIGVREAAVNHLTGRAGASVAHRLTTNATEWRPAMRVVVTGLTRPEKTARTARAVARVDRVRRGRNPGQFRLVLERPGAPGTDEPHGGPTTRIGGKADTSLRPTASGASSIDRRRRRLRRERAPIMADATFAAHAALYDITGFHVRHPSNTESYHDFSRALMASSRVLHLDAG